MAAKQDSEDPSWGKDLKLPAPGNPARDVLAGLAVAEPVLAEISAASTRPRCQFPLHYEDAFDTLLRHLSFLKSVSQAFDHRCSAHLALGETDAAFADAQAVLRVSDLLREEPLLISQLVRYAQNILAVHTVWQGLAGHHWSETQLAAFQDEFARRDFFPGALLSFEGERACSIRTVDTWIDRRENISEMIGPYDSGASATFPGKIVSRGLLRQNEIALIRYASLQISGIRAAISNAPQTGLAAVARTAADNAKATEAAGLKSHSPYRMLAAMVAPATGGAIAKTARTQTITKMAMIACALERYRLKQNVFPEKLDELVPAFLPAPPLDPMNNQPFHYHRTDDGWFQLYSVGLNGQDDGGVIKTRKTDKGELDWPWPVPSRPERYILF
jgi:hypothetical protein